MQFSYIIGNFTSGYSNAKVNSSGFVVLDATVSGASTVTVQVVGSVWQIINSAINGGTAATILDTSNASLSTTTHGVGFAWTGETPAVSFTGGDLNDMLIGGNANDTLYGGLGVDTVYGGPGDDALHAGSDRNRLAGNDGLDTLYGGDGADTLYGNAGNDLLYGNEGADSLYGNAGNDTIYGGDGADSILGQTEDDSIEGGLGNDRVIGNEGNDTLYGNEGADTIFGNAGNDSVLGGDDDDILSGDAGDDTLMGGNGADSLSGGNENDSLVGGDGGDTLTGGAGTDTLDGGLGIDIFLDPNGDTITTFETDDIIRLTGGGGQSFTTSHLQYNSGTKTLTVDFDKNSTFGGGTDVVIVFTNAPASSTFTISDNTTFAEIKLGQGPAVIPATPPTGIVSISGVAEQGQTLSASNTLADVNGLGTISYQWQANGVNIQGATGSTLTLSQDHVSKTIGVTASYTDGLGTNESVASAATSTVANVNDQPAGGVTISGTVVQGDTLSATNSLADVDGLGVISYQWQVNGVDITGANSATYTLTEAEAGKTITVVASYTDLQGTIERVSSAATAKVTQRVDGVLVGTDTVVNGSQITNTQTVAPITSDRLDDPNTSNGQMADITLAKDASGAVLVQVSLPVGVGLSSSLSAAAPGTAPLTLREQLIAASQPRVTDGAEMSKIIGDGIDQFVPAISDQTQVTVRTITLHVANNIAPIQPILITGSNGTGESDPANPQRQEALVIDARNLPIGTVLQLDKVEFAIIIGPSTVLGGSGRNYVMGDGTSQFIVLGPEDDILHGGGGDDTIGSKGGDDKLFGDAGNDLVVGGEGADIIEGGSGNDVLVGGQSDAGRWTFSQAMDQTNGHVSAQYTPGSAVLTDGTGMSVMIKVDGGKPIDHRLDFLYQSAELRETVATVYQAMFRELPSVGVMNQWTTAGLSSEQLAQRSVDMLLRPLAGQTTEQQMRAVISRVWGADKLTDALVTIGVDYIQAGGTWGRVLQALAADNNVKASITTASGELSLTKTWTIADSGWSSDTGADTLLGGDGDDRLIGGEGNDVLDGGAGEDTAVWTGLASNLLVRVVGSGASRDVAVINSATGETDIIRNIEFLQIGDKRYDASELQNIAAVATYLETHADAHLEVVLVGLAATPL